jgi:glucoamylase
MAAGKTLRIPLAGIFRLRWTLDHWASWLDTDASPTAIGIYHVDLPTTAGDAGKELEFTFFYPDTGSWKGQNFTVDLHA